MGENWKIDEEAVWLVCGRRVRVWIRDIFSNGSMSVAFLPGPDGQLVWVNSGELSRPEVKPEAEAEKAAVPEGFPIGSPVRHENATGGVHDDRLWILGPAEPLDDGNVWVQPVGFIGSRGNMIFVKASVRLLHAAEPASDEVADPAPGMAEAAPDEDDESQAVAVIAGLADDNARLRARAAYHRGRADAGREAITHLLLLLGSRGRVGRGPNREGSWIESRYSASRR